MSNQYFLSEFETKKPDADFSGRAFIIATGDRERYYLIEANTPSLQALVNSA
jgi:hypothetical protein